MLVFIINVAIVLAFILIGGIVWVAWSDYRDWYHMTLTNVLTNSAIPVVMLVILIAALFKAKSGL